MLYYSAMPDKKRTGRLDWEDVRYFVALARHGTLSSTARSLRVNHATVARRIVSLETLIGRPLFDRRATGYVLLQKAKPCSKRRVSWTKRRFLFCAASMPARS